MEIIQKKKKKKKKAKFVWFFTFKMLVVRRQTAKNWEKCPMFMILCGIHYKFEVVTEAKILKNLQTLLSQKLQL